MELSALTAISPVDGRYQNKTDALRSIFSEYGFFRFRIAVEIEWLKSLSNHADIKDLDTFTADSISFLDDIKNNFSIDDAIKIKELEQTTNHDVKAVEYFLREKIKSFDPLKNATPFIHFACTSEDINNVSHGLMLKDARDVVLVPKLNKLLTILKKISNDHASVAMLARTHGQAASPTTLGKEIAVYVNRLSNQIEKLEAIKLLGKFNGAVGNFNAHFAAYPSVNWLSLSQDFIEKLGLDYNSCTTQIEPHDYIAEYFHALIRINTILIDLCRDIWSYISIGYFKQQHLDGEIGSSTMPHKINPIDFENSEGNLGLSNNIFEHFAMKLPISRWQRDLSDSTVIRNMGVGVAHSIIAFDSCIKGLSKLEVDAEKMNRDLQDSWEVLTEAIQTIMRRSGDDNAYEKLKELSRGKKIDKKSLHNFIDQLNISDDDKSRLKELSPNNYLGNAETQAKSI